MQARKLISQEQLHFKGIEGHDQGNESQMGGFGHSRSNVGKVTGALLPSNHTPGVVASITDTKRSVLCCDPNDISEVGVLSQSPETQT